jgi:hypothetical protein
MKREVIDCARCLTRFFSTLFPILILFAIALASANDSDPRARTVTQFMRDQQVLGRGGGDGMLMYRLISRESF